MISGLELVLTVVGTVVAAGVVLAVAQALGLLPQSWTPQRFKAWFDRKRRSDDGDR